MQKINETDPTKLLEAAIGYWDNRYDSGNDSIVLSKKFFGIGENGNHLNNGLFGNLLQTMQNDTKLQAASEHISKTFLYNSAERAELISRMRELSQYGKQLPPKPLIANKWSDYRIDFSGTIESWYSNRDRNKKDAVSQFFGKAELDSETGEMKNETAGIGVGLAKIQRNITGTTGVDISEGILQETLDYIASLNNDHKKLTTEFVDTLNSYYLPTLRQELNEWSQQDYHNDKYGSKKNYDFLPKNWHKLLNKKIQKMPLFFGENKRILWEQLYNLKHQIPSELSTLEIVLEKLSTNNEITSKQISMLASLSNRIQQDGNKEIIKILQNIEQVLGIKFTDQDIKAKFYLSGFERGKYKQLDIPSKIDTKRLISIVDLAGLYKTAKFSPHKNNLLRDTVQLSKIVLSACLVDGPKDIQKKVALVHSNLQGYSALLSKKEFISRYSVQSANGVQCLLAQGKGLSSPKKRKGKIKNPVLVDRYFYVFNDFNASDTKLSSKLNKVIKGNSHNPEDLQEVKENKFALQVYSSKYQVQFLDWFMGKHQKKNSSLIVGGAFSIAEKVLSINWDLDAPQISAKNNKRVYVSQPFTIVPTEIQVYKTKNVKNRFIGVDIGEYGLAWSSISVVGSRVTELENGFLADKQQQKLKFAVNNWRKNQAGQTFTAQDTYIARLRESLIGSYRNQLEELAMAKQATLVFEYEVSGFESGGNRVAKVYSSIKLGDVFAPNSPQNSQAWGKVKKDQLNWAYEITAAGTSQTCTKCNKWASLAIDETKTYKLQDYEDNLFKVKLPDGEARLLGKPGMKAGDEINAKDLKSCIYKAMRPNMQYEKNTQHKDDLSKPKPSLGLQIVKRKCENNELNNVSWSYIIDNFGTSDKKHNRKYGNSAIFVCPYTNCQHVSHADLQAAFNIALRGYLKSIHKEDKGAPKTGYLTADNYTSWLQGLEYQPLGII